MLNLRNIFIGVLMFVFLMFSGCSDKEQKNINLEILKQAGFVINPESKPPVEILGAESGWNGTLKNKEVTILLFRTDNAAHDAVSEFKKIALGKGVSCSIHNMMLIIESGTCEKLVEVFK